IRVELRSFDFAQDFACGLETPANGSSYFGHQYQPFRCLSGYANHSIVVGSRSGPLYDNSKIKKSMAPTTQLQQSSGINARAAAIEQSLRSIIRGNDEVLRLA